MDSPLLLLVPLHGRLSRGPDEELARRLLRGDRTRVAVWTAASAVALALVTTAPHGPA